MLKCDLCKADDRPSYSGVGGEWLCDLCKDAPKSRYLDETERLLGQHMPGKFKDSSIQRHRMERAEREKNFSRVVQNSSSYVNHVRNKYK